MISLHSRLRDALQPWHSAPGWCVALSGGLDSTVLLHLLASLARREALPPLSAIHIHHGLQTAADAWPAHCRELCAALSVPLQVEHVQVAPGASLEQAARQARYAAFAARLGVDEGVMPALLRRWPQASANIARSAAHLSEAGQLLDELARQDVAAAEVSGEFAWLGLPSLALPTLRGLSEPRQRNALRYWLRPLTAMPDSEHWAGWQVLRDAAVDAAPVWKLAAGELRRSDERLWWLAGDWLRAPVPVHAAVQGNQQLVLPGNGRVRIDGILPAGDWQLGYRRGGEQIFLPGRGHRDLKRLFNELRVPAFVRDRLPLLRLDNQVVAIASLAGVQGAADGSWQLHWQPAGVIKV